MKPHRPGPYDNRAGLFLRFLVVCQCFLVGTGCLAERWQPTPEEVGRPAEVVVGASDHAITEMRVVKYLERADSSLEQGDMVLVGLAQEFDPDRIAVIRRSLRELTFTDRQFTLFGIGELCRLRFGYDDGDRFHSDEEYVLYAGKRMVFTSDYAQGARLDGSLLYDYFDETLPYLWRLTAPDITNAREVIVEGAAPVFAD